MTITSITAAYGAQIQGTKESLKSGKNAGSKPATPNERVQISDTSKEMQSVRETIAKAPDVRVELVVEIKRKVKGGDYPLEHNLSKAIDRMIQEKIIG